MIEERESFSLFTGLILLTHYFALLVANGKSEAGHLLLTIGFYLVCLTWRAWWIGDRNLYADLKRTRRKWQRRVVWAFGYSIEEDGPEKEEVKELNEIVQSSTKMLTSICFFVIGAIYVLALINLGLLKPRAFAIVFITAFVLIHSSYAGHLLLALFLSVAFVIFGAWMGSLEPVFLSLYVASFFLALFAFGRLGPNKVQFHLSPSLRLAAIFLALLGFFHFVMPDTSPQQKPTANKLLKRTGKNSRDSRSALRDRDSSSSGGGSGGGNGGTDSGNDVGSSGGEGSSDGKPSDSASAPGGQQPESGGKSASGDSKQESRQGAGSDTSESRGKAESQSGKREQNKEAAKAPDKNESDTKAPNTKADSGEGGSGSGSGAGSRSGQAGNGEAGSRDSSGDEVQSVKTNSTGSTAESPTKTRAKSVNESLQAMLKQLKEMLSKLLEKFGKLFKFLIVAAAAIAVINFFLKASKKPTPERVRRFSLSKEQRQALSRFFANMRRRGLSPSDEIIETYNALLKVFTETHLVRSEDIPVSVFADSVQSALPVVASPMKEATTCFEVTLYGEKPANEDRLNKFRSNVKQILNFFGL